MLQILQKEPSVTAYVSRTFDDSYVIVEKAEVPYKSAGYEGKEKT